MENVTIGIEQTHDGYWSYLQRSAGELKKVHIALRWLLEQLLLGHSKPETDERGDVVSLSLGRSAALGFDSAEDCLDHAQKAVMHLGITGVVAREREQGTEPEDQATVSKASMLAQTSNLTEVYYAFQVIEVLRRISDLSLALSALPIKGRVPLKLIWDLEEATRCYLYGFHRACIVLCRACLEDALKERLSTPEGEKKMREDGSKPQRKGYLERMIDVADDLGYLGKDLWKGPAHALRKRANQLLHAEAVQDEDSRSALEHTKGVIACLFPA